MAALRLIRSHEPQVAFGGATPAEAVDRLVGSGGECCEPSGE